MALLPPPGGGEPPRQRIEDASCAQLQDTLDRATQALAIYDQQPIHLPGLREALVAAIQDVRDRMKAAGCVVVEPAPASIFTPLIQGLGAAVEATVPAIAEFFARFEEELKPTVRTVAMSIRDRLTKMGLGAQAGNVDTSGDVLAFLGSLQDLIIDERLLTGGPLSFDEVLAYENRLSGIRTAVVLVSWVFAQVVEVVSIGQVKGGLGLLIHLVDDIVGDSSRVVTTQLMRRAVGDPLGEGYKLVHRTGRLSTSELEEGYAIGLVDDPELVDGLARDGFDDRAVELKGQLAAIRRFRNAGIEPVRRTPLSASVLGQLLRGGVIDEATFIARLVDRGYSDDDVQALLALNRLKIPPPPGGG